MILGRVLGLSIGAIQHFLEQAFVILQEILPVEIEEDEVADTVIGVPVDVIHDPQQVVGGGRPDDGQCQVKDQGIGPQRRRLAVGA